MTKSDDQPRVHQCAPHKTCGAHARRTGQPCKGWAMANGRCRLHGGKSTGPRNPHKRITHGLRTQEAMARKKEIQAFLKVSHEMLDGIGTAD